MFWKKTKTITVHDGHFHPDDIFAVALLSLILEKDFNIKVIRTREKIIIDKSDYVVDVGGVYDKENNRFDHHQLEGAGNHENGIPFASFGLVWQKYGLEICEGSQDTFFKLENKLVIPIDAFDNGIDIEKNLFENIKDYSLFNFFQTFIPTWKEDFSVLDNNFIYLVSIAKDIIKREVKTIKDTLEGTSLIEELYKNTVDKRLLILDKPYKYKEFTQSKSSILLIVFPNSINNNWFIECAKEDLVSFKSRIDFPESWAGKRDLELEKETGVSGSVFCHKNRYLVVTKTKRGAFEIAKKLLPDLEGI